VSAILHDTVTDAPPSVLAPTSTHTRHSAGERWEPHAHARGSRTQTALTRPIFRVHARPQPCPWSFLCLARSTPQLTAFPLTHASLHARPSMWRAGEPSAHKRVPRFPHHKTPRPRGIPRKRKETTRPSLTAAPSGHSQRTGCRHSWPPRRQPHSPRPPQCPRC